MRLKLHYLFLLFLITLISVSVGFSLLLQVTAQSVDYQVVGYAWSDKFGWISLSDTNCRNASTGTCLGAGEYGVYINGSGVLSGYGWSEHVGWVCFGDTCGGTGGTVPGGGASSARVDSSTGKITGWAKIVSLGNDGWIKLGRGAGRGSANGQIGQDCYDCREVCTPVLNEAGEEIGQDCDLQCNACFLKTCFQTDLINTTDGSSNCPLAHQLPLGIGDDDPVSGGSDLMCSGFKKCEQIDVPVGEQTLSRIECTDGLASVCEAYGVNRNNTDGMLFGWGWNGNNDNGVTGAGWVKFHGGDARIVYPWLQTQYGSIYVQPGRSIKQQTGTAGKNATYCIFADSVANVTSANCAQLVKDVALGFPTDGEGSTIYRNALGKIDVQGLITKLSGQERNKYGNTVVTFDDDNDVGGDVVLDNMVFHFTGPVIIDSDVTFQNGSNGEFGNGLIVVDGDLIIKSNMAYDQDPVVGDLRQLASVAWVVKGDIIISPNVTSVVGAFIALGNGGVCAPNDLDSEYPEYTQNGCGVFYSVDPATTDNNQQLSVLGLVIAKAFDFRRTFTDALIGSENIIYDGRLIANPPPGLKGFTEGLPVIRDF
jgi:hypothetical protein